MNRDLNLEEISTRLSVSSMATDKAEHSYLPRYDGLFHNLRDKKIKILEVGVFAGASLALWAEYFPNAEIVGVDITGRFLRTELLEKYPNVRVEIRDFYKNPLDDKFDIAIDDGSHYLIHQLTFLDIMRQRLQPGGMAIIEDISTESLRVFRMLKDLLSNTELYDMRANKNIGDDVMFIWHAPEVAKSVGPAGSLFL